MVGTAWTIPANARVISCSEHGWSRKEHHLCTRAPLMSSPVCDKWTRYDKWQVSHRLVYRYVMHCTDWCWFNVVHSWSVFALDVCNTVPICSSANSSLVNYNEMWNFTICPGKMTHMWSNLSVWLFLYSVIIFIIILATEVSVASINIVIIVVSFRCTMAGNRDGRDESQDGTSREPCTAPLLQQQQQILTTKEPLLDSCTEQEPPCTLPLLQQDIKQKESCLRHPLQDIQTLEPCTIPLLANLDLSLTTPMGTPIPGRAIAIHGTCTPLSGTSTPILDCKTVSVDSVSLVLPGPRCHCDSKSQLSMLSDTNSALLPICRICHLPEDGGDILISPCRCAGTLQFIHNTCLMVGVCQVIV